MFEIYTLDKMIFTANGRVFVGSCTCLTVGVFASDLLTHQRRDPTVDMPRRYGAQDDDKQSGSTGYYHAA